MDRHSRCATPPEASFIVKLDMRERAPGCLSAVCPDVPGLHVVGETPEAVRRSAMLAIPRLMKVNRQMNVEVDPTDDPNEIRVREI